MEKNILASQPDSPHTVVYTSGTTGEQKGVLIRNLNISSMVARTKSHLLGIQPILVAYLPLSHILQRTSLYRRLFSGYTMAFPLSVERLKDAITDLRPHAFATVPRVLEKMRDRIFERVKKASSVQQKIFQWGLQTGKTYIQAKLTQKLTFKLRFQYFFSDFLVGRKVRKGLGNRIHFLGCGGAPLHKDVELFFWGFGIKIFQGYGLTESTAPASGNLPKNIKLGTVGKAMPGMKIKIASDGEILLQGESVFKEYYKNPIATKEAFEDGWFKTGDLGEMDEDGYLKIVGRKKELIITSGGKNVAPAPIEAEIRTVLGVGEVMLIGNNKPYLSTLIFLEPDAPFEKTLELIQHAITCYNLNHANFEKIRRMAVIAKELRIEDGEITATLKVRRGNVARRYSKIIEDLYSGKNNLIEFRTDPLSKISSAKQARA